MLAGLRRRSTTSLAKHAPTTGPDDNLDFCNGFWGVDDEGVDVLFTRMRSAARTIDELRNFWKERSAIEEEYAKRLAKLARMPVARDEIGELRNSIDTLRLETVKQAEFHSQLAQHIQTDVEGSAGVFASRQQDHKKTYQVPIEKEFKAKKTKEQHVRKAREKYESDCLRINSYTAQSALVQGRDLEKIGLKLERARQTVQVSENGYAQLTTVLQETMQKWEQDWKTFCDTCQDLEEHRAEFMKDNMWAYANAVSEVCVSDIETRDTMCVALEKFDPEKDMENFVLGYGTGNAIPELPAFVSYAKSNAPPVPSTRIATRPSNLSRSTKRANRAAALPQDDEPHDDTNYIGHQSRIVPADAPILSRSATQRSTTTSWSPENGTNGHVHPTRETQRRQSIAAGAPKPAFHGDSVDPTASHMQPRTSPRAGEQDLLVKQMAELSAAAAASGTLQRNTIRQGGPPSSVESRKGTDSLSTPSTATNASSAPRDFQSSADAVVGSYPLARTPTSPNPPKAVLAAPPPASVPPSTSDVPVEQIVSGYQRPLPGESRSRVNSHVGPPPVVNQNADSGVSRPTSRAGYPGIGIQSLVARPTSPAHGPSPAAVQPYNRGPPASSEPHRGVSVSHHPIMPTNPIGITLRPDGRVAHDVMAQPVQQGLTHYMQGGLPTPQAIQPPQARSGYRDANRVPTHAPQQAPTARNDHRVVASSTYDQGLPYNYGHRQGGEHPPQYQYQQAPSPAQAQDYGQLAQSARYASAETWSVYRGHQQNQSVGNVAAVQQQQRHAGNAGPVYRPTGPGIGRSPSPVAPRGHMPSPTGAYTDDNRPILFYVNALYDYSAVEDDEFGFQAGDVIAVTDTPDDGWWSGELLDERRRQAGRHVFPSNFVCLL